MANYYGKQENLVLQPEILNLRVSSSEVRLAKATAKKVIWYRWPDSN